MILKDKRAQFIVLFALIFTVIPMLCRNIIPHDMIENLYWGKEWQLGYAKHPPLFAWVSWVFFKFYELLSNPELLGLLFVFRYVVAYVFIFKIVKLFRRKNSEALSVVIFFQIAVVLFQLGMDSIFLLFSLPATLYFSIKAEKFQKKSDLRWLCFFALLSCETVSYSYWIFPFVLYYFFRVTKHREKQDMFLLYYFSVLSCFGMWFLIVLSSIVFLIGYFFWHLIIFDQIAESMYLLTQLNLLIGCIYIYKIAKLIGQKKDQCFSTIFFFLVSAAAVFGNTKFNATTILFSLLPIVFYLFLRMMRFQKISDAILLGFFAMLACIGKYFALLFLGCMGLFLICDPDCRKLLKTSLPYIALLSFLICISWHVIWIYQNDFITLRYGLEKSVTAVSRRWHAINFLLMMVLFFGTSVLALFRCSKTHHVFDNCISFYVRDQRILQHYFLYTPEERFVIMMTLVPTLTMFLISLLTGMRIGSFWCVNMCMLIGVYFNILNKDINHKKLFSFTKKITATFACVMMIQFSLPNKIWEFRDPMRNINAKKLVQVIERAKENSFGSKKIGILHADKPTAFLHAYLKDSPSFYDIKSYGQFQPYGGYDRSGLHLATFVTEKDDGKISAFKNKYGDKIKVQGTFHIDCLYLQLRPWGNVSSNYDVYYAFIEVKGNERKD